MAIAAGTQPRPMMSRQIWSSERRTAAGGSWSKECLYAATMMNEKSVAAVLVYHDGQFLSYIYIDTAGERDGGERLT